MTLATQVQAAIEKYCGTKFSSTTTVVRMNGGHKELIVQIGPIISITSIVDKDDSDAVIAATLYDFYELEGMIYKEDGSTWGLGRRRYEITYQAGYASIPEDVQLAIDTWVAYLTANDSGAISSYKTGDDEETYHIVTDMPDTVKSLISKYKRIVFGC